MRIAARIAIMWFIISAAAVGLWHLHKQRQQPFANLPPGKVVTAQHPCPETDKCTFYIDPDTTEPVNYKVPRWSMVRTFWYEVARDGTVMFHIQMCAPLPEHSSNLMALRIDFKGSRYVIVPLYGYTFPYTDGLIVHGEAALVEGDHLLTFLPISIVGERVLVVVPAWAVKQLGRRLDYVWTFYAPEEYGSLIGGYFDGIDLSGLKRSVAISVPPSPPK